MGHGKNKQKNQKVGLGQQPKETREERRRRIEEEAKAREVCLPRLIVKKDDNNVLGFDLLWASTLRTVTHLLLSFRSCLIHIMFWLKIKLIYTTA